MAFSWPRQKSRRPKTTRRTPFKRVLAFEIAEQRLMLAVDYLKVADSLEGQLFKMQGVLTASLNVLQTGPTSTIPVVGDKLGHAAQFVTSFSDQLHAGLSELGTNATPTDAQIQSALATHLNSFLAGAGVSGVHLSHIGGATKIDMILQGTVDNRNVGINFDTGLPSLPVKLIGVGAITLDVRYALNLSFTIDASGLVSLNEGGGISGVKPPDADHPIVDVNNSLAIFVSASLSSDFRATATFGFVQGTATAIPSLRNGLYATALVSNLTGTPSIKLDGGADVNLRLDGSFAGTNEDFPGISTDFHLHWSLNSAAPSLLPPSVSFDNVSLSFGEFLSNVLTPVLSEIQGTTKQFKPVLKFLTTEVPGITDLSKATSNGPITVGSLAALGSEVVGAGPLADLVLKVGQVLDKINSFQVGKNVRLPLGGFDLNSPLNGDLRAAVKSGDVSKLELKSITSLVASNVQAGAQAYRDFVNGLSLGQDEKDMLNSLVSIPNNGFQIAFPLLDDPAKAVFNLILGKDSDLFYLKADADVDLEGSRATGLGIFGLPISFVGRADVKMHFKFAYDTFGLRQLINNIAAGDLSHIPSDITDGFYIAADSYFKVAGGVFAEAGTSNGIFDWVVDGGMSTGDHGAVPVSISIIDPNSDGKLRISEFGKDGAFITSGEVDAGLSTEIRIGKEILGHFFGIKKRFDIAKEVLIQFADPTPPVIASTPDANGKVTLFLGQNANLRTGLGLDQIDGDESFTISHVGVNPLGGENIRVSAFGVSQTLENVRSIEAMDGVGELSINVLPGVTSDVHFVGGQGPANLVYRGKGSAALYGGALASTISGGSGSNVLVGGPGDDTIILGSGTNAVEGGSGQNTIVVEAPIFQNATVSGGSGPNNSLQILGSPTTVGISAIPVGSSIDLGIQNKINDPEVHLQLSNIGHVFVSAQDSIANFRFGDLSAVGVTDITLNMTSSFPAVRSVEVDSRIANAPSLVAIHPLVNEYDDPQHPGQKITEQGVTVANSTTGLTVQVLGLSNRDAFTLLHHGGSIDVDPLGLVSGKFIFDTSLRAPGNLTDTIHLNTPPRADGHLVLTDSSNDVLVSLTDYPSFRIQGDTPLDILNLNVAAPSSGANLIDINASSVKGALNVNLLGSATAIHHVTLSAAGPQSSVSIFGQDTTSDLLFGTGKLSLIQNDVYASNVQLSIDNRDATESNRLYLEETTFGNWLVPSLVGVAPKLTFAQLHGPMSIYAGAGDRYQLDATPLSITSLSMFNTWKASQDQVYTSNWSVPLTLKGNFAFFAGQNMRRDGSVERVKRLNNVAVPVEIYFDGDAPTQIVLDGDLDPPGAEYGLDALEGAFRLNNKTVGLRVNIFGLRDADTMYIFMSGGKVQGNLESQLPGTIAIDGRARLAGNHSASPNDIQFAVAAGTATMVPVDTNDSLLATFNKIYVLGSMPQDNLDITAPTTFKMAATVPGTGPTTWSIAHPKYGLFTPAVAYLPPEASFVLLNVGFLDPFFETSGFAVHFPFLEAGDAKRDSVLYSEVTGFQIILRDYGETVGVAAVRTFPIDLDPRPVNNDVTLNASQLRGKFSFRISEPDYVYATKVMNAINDLGGYFPYMKPVTNFGQANINLTHTNPELVTNLLGTPPISSAMYEVFVAPGYRSVNRFPGTKIHVGGGTIANVKGDVNVDQAWLSEVDDRNGVEPTTIGSTDKVLSWNPQGNHSVSLTMSHLQGDLTLTGSPFDTFNIEGTPNSASKFSIRNFSSSLHPNDVYLSAKSVMPFDITGNFNLTVGRHLNADGTTTVGGVLNGISRGKRYQPTGEQTAGGLWRNFGFVSQYATLIDPIVNNGLLNFEFYDYLSESHHQIPLPMTFNYTGPASSTFTFDASSDTYNAGVANGVIANGGLIGISTNQYFPGKSDLSFLGTHVIYGSNSEVFFHGPQLTPGTNPPNANPGLPVLLENYNASPVHYFANPNNANPGLMELVLVGNAKGPVFIEGSGKSTRVELNPLYSLPHKEFLQTTGPDGSTTQGFPGWGLVHSSGSSLNDTITADVTVSNAALRVIADLPTSTGELQYASRPNVNLTQNELRGITGGTIHFNGLVDSFDVRAEGINAQNINDLAMKKMPGLSIQLPTSLTSATTVEDTPANVTTVISTIRAPQELQNSSGPITVLGTSGSLFFGPYALGNELRFTWAGTTSSSNNSIRWVDSICVPQITIGDHGSLAKIHAPILFDADVRSNSPTIINIEGQGDPSRAKVEFSSLTEQQRNDFLTQYPMAQSLFSPQIQIQGMASAPILFGTKFTEALRPVNVLGSAGSHYSIIDSRGAPSGLKLITGADGVVSSESLTGTIVGATTVQLALGSAGNSPETRIQQDPSHPQPISMKVKRKQFESDGGTLFLDRLNDSSFRLARSAQLQAGTFDYWRVLFDGNVTTLSVDYGIPVTINDTGTAGTTVGTGNPTIKVTRTTGPLQIKPIELIGNPSVTLGDGNTQSMNGSIDILQNANDTQSLSVRFNDANDTTARNIAMTKPQVDRFAISGLTSVPVTVTGTNLTFSLDGGTQNNSLTSNQPVNTWVIDGANSGKLNRNISFTGMRNLISDSGNDQFIFKTNGLVSGNIDGGAGIDAIYYQNGMLGPNDTINLPNQIAPRVGGQARNLETSGSFDPLTVTRPENFAVQYNADMKPVTIVATGGLGVKAFEASGLPTGVQIDALTGVISGKPNVENFFSLVTIRVTDDTGTLSTVATWTTLPGLLIPFQGNRSSQVTEEISLQLKYSYTYPGTLAFTATGLPNGLSINSQTGLISGTIAEGAQLSSPYFVEVRVTDGTHSDFTTFYWTVQKTFALQNPGNQITPDTVPVSLKIRALNSVGTVSFSASGLPGGLSINPQTGVISGAIANYWFFYHQNFTFGVTVIATDSQKSTSIDFNWQTLPGFTPVGIENRTNLVAEEVSFPVYGFDSVNGGTITYTVENLPPGISYDANTRMVQGRLDNFADNGGPYHPKVTFTNTVYNYSYPMTFEWQVLPNIILTNPVDQASHVGDVVDFTVAVERNLGSPLTFSASNLPEGLAIDSATGRITGTIGYQIASPLDTFIQVAATDGVNTGYAGFQWHVDSGLPNVAVLAEPIHGGTITITSPLGTRLSASYSNQFVDGETGAHLPDGFPFKFLNLTVDGLVPGGSAQVTISPSSPQVWKTLYLQGSSPSEPFGWYEFLYQKKTGANDASSTGAEFLPNGDIVLHFVDGARGDSYLDAPDGVINAYDIGPSTRVQRSVFTVDSLKDTPDANPGDGIAADASGKTTLRAAIQEANATPNTVFDNDLIQFNLPGTVPSKIVLTSPLPPVAESLVIDGRTLTAYTNGIPGIEISGEAISAPSANVDGLRVRGSQSEIYGLSITGFSGDAIELVNAGEAIIQGNYLGVSPANSAKGNKGYGLRLNNSYRSTIDSNVIGANSLGGVSFAGPSAAGNLLTSNLIGVDATGQVAIPNLVDGIVIDGPLNTIGKPGKGNVISGNLKTGVNLTVNAYSTIIQGNFIGTDESGKQAIGNGVHGIWIRSSSNLVGGDQTLGEGNLISGNSVHGIVLTGTSANENRLSGNRIGSDSDGLKPVPNGVSGISIMGGKNNTIGGSVKESGNLVSGNGTSGVVLAGGGTTQNVVSHNFVGSKSDGMSALANGGYGISIRDGSFSNVIQENLVSGNTNSGIAILDPFTRNNAVRGNLIGTKANGVEVLGNGLCAIVITSPSNLIGGSNPGDGNVIVGSSRGIAIYTTDATRNVIAGNSIGTDASGTVAMGMTTGVQFASGSFGNIVGPSNVIANNATGVRLLNGSGVGNRVTANSIYSNSVIGIDLGNAGPTANDSDDVDNGPNRLQNYPVLSSAKMVNGNLRIQYSVPSTPANSAYKILVQFFVSNSTGQGRRYLGARLYAEADFAAGSKQITMAVSGIQAGDYLTATATDVAGNTSEFSAAVAIDTGILSGFRATAGSQSAFDVNADAKISPLDALLVINALNSAGSEGEEQGSRKESELALEDVNRDGRVTPLDALLVINWLNLNQGGSADLVLQQTPVPVNDSIDHSEASVDSLAGSLEPLFVDEYFRKQYDKEETMV